MNDPLRTTVMFVTYTTQNNLLVKVAFVCDLVILLMLTCMQCVGSNSRCPGDVMAPV